MTAFTPSHRGGSGEPLVLVHGFTDTWRTWEPVLPALEQRFDVFAPTLAGHAGGPPLSPDFDHEVLLNALEAALDEAGLDTAHVVGNSLGGYAALKLAERGRARSVVALAPAGGWVATDDAWRDSIRFFRIMQDLVRQAAPHADALMASPEGRRRATEYSTVNFEHLPAELLAHQLRGAAQCSGATAMLDYAAAHGWELDPARISCPVRIVWGHEDRVLTWPAAAIRYRQEWLPDADWVELPQVGHCPQLDVPDRTVELILEIAGRPEPAARVAGEVS